MAGIPMSNYAPHPNSITVLGVMVDLGAENGANRNVVTIFFFYFYTQLRPIWHRLATIHNVEYRQTEALKRLGI